MQVMLLVIFFTKNFYNLDKTSTKLLIQRKAKLVCSMQCK